MKKFSAIIFRRKSNRLELVVILLQIKVFKAGNMKDAMAAMKAELGEDAVILHSKKYKEGGLLGIGSREVVEITAAVEETSMPKRPEPPRITQQIPRPTVAPNSLLTRYKTDGTAQAVTNAERNFDLQPEKKDDVPRTRPTLFTENISRTTQADGLAEKISAQKKPSLIQVEPPKQSFDDMLKAAQEESVMVDLQPVKEPESVTKIETVIVEPEPVKEIQPIAEPEPIEEFQPPVTKIETVAEPAPVEEIQSPVTEPENVSESKPVEEIQPPVTEPENVTESAPIEEIQPPVAETETVAETKPVEKIQPPVEESAQPVTESEPVEKIPSPVEEPAQPVKKSEPVKEQPQSQGVTPEQLAQTQAMILAQFNQMQMMQQAALAQAQANAQAQAQATEQLRLQQQAALQAQAQAQQAQAQAQAQARAQAQAQTQAQPTDPQSEDKIKRLEEEISHMKALLAEVLGREPKKGNISLHEALKLQEVDEEILTEMATQANAGDTLVDIHAPTAKATLINYLNEHIKFSDGVKLNRHGVRIAALLGTTGVGKTTTLAKIAAKFVLEQKTNVALITADTYRISAVEQLKTYSDILELPLEIVYSPSELASALERHRDKELILIDTAGRSQHNEYQMRELEEFLRVNPRIEKHLVISATTKFTDARQIMNKFSKVEPDRIIFTKIDETGSLGMIINLLRDNKYSLSYLTTGQSVPDDIERASSDILANLLLKKVEELRGI